MQKLSLNTKKLIFFLQSRWLLDIKGAIYFNLELLLAI